MEINLTTANLPSTISSAGETEAGSVEVQPARDNQPKATNCRGDGGLISAIPLSQPQKTILSFPMPQKTWPCRRQGILCVPSMFDNLEVKVLYTT
jgi:hypothetical protein